MLELLLINDVIITYKLYFYEVAQQPLIMTGTDGMFACSLDNTITYVTYRCIVS